MPNWDRHCIICGTAGSYLDFSPAHGDPSTQSCQRYPDDGCSATVAWLDVDLTDEASPRRQGIQSSSFSR
jgi:hypothetical protein